MLCTCRCALVNNEATKIVRLSISSEWEDNIKYYLNPTSQYNVIILNNMSVIDDRLCETFRHCLPYIKKAKIKGVRFTAVAFADFLHRTTMLEELVIHDLTVLEHPTSLAPCTRSLKKLVLKTVNWHCMWAFKNIQISELMIKNSSTFINIDKHTREFLESQRDLQTLILKEFQFSLLNYLSSLQRTFGITRLVIVSSDARIPSKIKHWRGTGLALLKDYLKLFKKTELDYLQINIVTEDLMNFVLKNLKVRALDLFYVSKEENPEKDFPFNTSVKKLFIDRCHTSDPNLVIKIVDACKSIEHLTLGDLCVFNGSLIFQSIYFHQPTISYLSVPKLIATSGFPLHLSSLKTLEIGALEELGPNQSYCIDFKGIEKITIRLARPDAFRTVAMPDTEYLKLGITTQYTVKDVKTVYKQCPKLCYLVLFAAKNSSC